MPPRLLILSVGFLVHTCCKGQQEFHGRITYHSGDTGIFSLRANCHFAPGKVRIDVVYPLLPGDDHAYAPFEIFDLDERMVYISEPRSRILQKIEVDTQWSLEYAEKKRLAEKKVILGYNCFGIESTYPAEKIPNDNGHIMVRTVGWYAEELTTTFRSPYPLALRGITDEGYICLMLESKLFTEKDTSDIEIEFIAEEIIPGIPDSTLFALPTGYETIEFRVSELLRKREPVTIPVRQERTHAKKNKP